MKRVILVCLLTAAVLALAATGMAQQRFPGRPGDWEFTSKSEGLPEPVVLRMCLTDETWSKALTQNNSSCKIQQVSATSTNLHWKLDCEMRSGGKGGGDVELTFDGPEHMTGKSAITMTVRGQTMNMSMQLDYRWKGPVCTDADVNMKKKTGD